MYNITARNSGDGRVRAVAVLREHRTGNDGANVGTTGIPRRDYKACRRRLMVVGMETMGRVMYHVEDKETRERLTTPTVSAAVAMSELDHINLRRMDSLAAAST